MATQPADDCPPIEGPTAAQYRQNRIWVLAFVVAYLVVMFLIMITAKHFNPEWFDKRASCAQAATETVAGGV